MQKWIVDKIENDIAIIECNGELLNIPLAFLPANIEEGDIIVLQKEHSSKAESLRDAEDRLKRLKAKNPTPSNIIDL